MDYKECLAYIASRWTDELVVTSAGTSSELWFDITGDTERVFYLEASMSLSTLFAAGIAVGVPERTVWAFSGDGAFAMNPGMLMVERDLDLPNLKHFLVSNRAYGSTSNVPLPGRSNNDYAAIARGFGVGRVYSFASLNELKGRFDEAAMTPGYTFIHLEVDPTSYRSQSPPMDGPEVKFRFGRHVERATGRAVFDAPLSRAAK
jgi:thiamine pyrophosphate-dependent acetolactate synthase large subunit-like protein